MSKKLKKEEDRLFLSITGHDSSADKHHKKHKSYGEAVDAVHKFFLSCGFEVHDEKPYCTGHGEYPDPAGFKAFSNVIMHKGKVAQFTHCDGDGPVAEIEEI